MNHLSKKWLLGLLAFFVIGTVVFAAAGNRGFHHHKSDAGAQLPKGSSTLDGTTFAEQKDVHEHDICRTVANSGAEAKGYFIPTKSAVEWATFRDAAGDPKNEVAGTLAVHKNYLADLTLGECCEPDCSLAASHCGQFSDGCEGMCQGTKTANCACAASTCIGQSCSDGCGGTCPGTMSCSTTPTPTPTCDPATCQFPNCCQGGQCVNCNSTTCTPRGCRGVTCGTLPDGCGGIVTCGGPCDNCPPGKCDGQQGFYCDPSSGQCVRNECSVQGCGAEGAEICLEWEGWMTEAVCQFVGGEDCWGYRPKQFCYQAGQGQGSCSAGECTCSDKPPCSSLTDGAEICYQGTKHVCRTETNSTSPFFGCLVVEDTGNSCDGGGDPNDNPPPTNENRYCTTDPNNKKVCEGKPLDVNICDGFGNIGKCFRDETQGGCINSVNVKTCPGHGCSDGKCINNSDPDPTPPGCGDDCPPPDDGSCQGTMCGDQCMGDGLVCCNDVICNTGEQCIDGACENP